MCVFKVSVHGGLVCIKTRYWSWGNLASVWSLCIEVFCIPTEESGLIKQQCIQCCSRLFKYKTLDYFPVSAESTLVHKEMCQNHFEASSCILELTFFSGSCPVHSFIPFIFRLDSVRHY